MAAISPSKRRRHADSNTLFAQVFLAVACLWPLALLAMLASFSQAPGPVTPSGNGNNHMPHISLRNMMDRVDIVGYGPTHPRVAVVVSGFDKEGLVASVESVFRTTDLNRIFVVTVIVDGHDVDNALEEKLKAVDKGSIPHWHGLRPDIHSSGKGEPHGSKVHVVFNKDVQGVSSCRADGVEFIKLLQGYHEEAGLKSPEEDLILLMVRAGAEIPEHSWLPAVTDALIVPPPLLDSHDEAVAAKLANAVSFNLEGPSKRTAFDKTLTATVADAKATDINESSGSSYATPVLSGAAFAMRLDTYINLPSQDLTLQDPWPANLELSLNLWLCGDGIDILDGVEVAYTDKSHPAPARPGLAARFAVIWMDELMQKTFFHAYTDVMKDVTALEWQTFLEQARMDAPTEVQTKCRSFEWYLENVNTELGEEFALIKDEIAAEMKAEEEEARKQLARDKAAQAKRKAAGVKEVSNMNDDTAVVPQRQEDGQKKPSKPLCKECLEIVQKAKQIDISFEDVSDGHKSHPHKGALDVDGNFGYIHNETALRSNPPAFEWSQQNIDHVCNKVDNNYRMLTERVFVDFEADAEANKLAEEGKLKRAKIFCLVYTIYDEKKHSRIPNIRETWGQKCDGFMVVSNMTDPSLGTVDVVHEGPEEYNNIWQKVRSMWSYIYDNYYTKYDFFHIGGDDLYLVVENLRLYLESEEIRTAANGGLYLPEGDETMQTPLFMGRRFAYQGDMNDIFISGGSGYTMNKAALKTLVVKGLPKFFPHRHTFSEDTMVAKVFREFGVYPYETKDENGGERYMPFMPGHHWGYRIPSVRKDDWYATYSINIKEGPEHCSPRSVAFHYVKDDAMKRLHTLLYKKCPERKE